MANSFFGLAGRLPKLFLEKNTPAYLIFFITSRCNSRCLTCFNWQNIAKQSQRQELTLEEIDKISGGFKNLLQVTISGGEPFLADHLVQAVKIFYANSGARLFTIPTNGLLPEKICLRSEELAQACPEAFFNICLSLDGIGPKHDKLRGAAGNFEKLSETYKRLVPLAERYPNITIKTTTVYSTLNQAEAREIIQYVREKFPLAVPEMLLARGKSRQAGVDQVDIKKYDQAQRLFNQSTSLKQPRRLWPMLSSALLALTNKLVRQIKEKGKMPLACLAGRRLLIIDDEGKVWPCETLASDYSDYQDHQDFCLGDLRQNNYDLNRILKSPKAKAVLGYIKRKNCVCTFECAISCSLVFQPRFYPYLVGCLLRSYLIKTDPRSV